MREDFENFVKVIPVDDWGSVGYYLKAEKGCGGTWSHATLDQSYRLKNGDKVEVRWPSGKVTDEVVRIVTHHTTVSDHGHQYPTDTETMHIELRDKERNIRVRFTDFDHIRIRRRE